MTGIQREHAVDDGLTIQRFVRSVGQRARWWMVGQALLGHALVVGLLLLLVELVRPAYLSLGAAAAGVWVVGVALWAARRAEVGVGRADRELGLGDRLRTYVGMEEREHAGAFATWLRRDLAQRLSRIPPSEAASTWKRPLGLVRYLVPVVIVLLLLRWFAPLPPAWPSLSGPSAQSAQGGGGQGGEDPQQSDPGDQPADPEPPPEPEPPAPEPPEEERPPDLAEPPPPPERDLQVVDQLVVPRFVGEGETRRTLTKLAVVERGGEAPEAVAGSQQGAPPSDLGEVEAALEQALRARHVPAAERAFVASYFEQLLEEVR